MRENLIHIIRVSIGPLHHCPGCRPAQQGLHACVITAACGLRGVLGHARRAYFEVLDKYTLADIAADQAKLSRLLGLGTAGDERPLVRIARSR